LTIVRGIIVPCVINPLLLVFLVPFIIGIYIIKSYYMNLIAKLERQHNTSRSSILICTKSTLDGLSTIRASDKIPLLVKEFHERCDYHSKFFFNRIASTRWFGIRMDLLCLGYVVLSIFGSILFKGFYIVINSRK